VEIIDQHGTRFTAPDWPVAAGRPLRAEGSGTLALTAEGGSGPITPPADSKSPVDAVAAGITPAKATNAVDVKMTAARAATAVGAPRLTLTYRGQLAGKPVGSRPTRVFAQLVDDPSGLVLGNQVTPSPGGLAGAEHTTSLPLEMIGHTFAAGESVTLQLVATTVAYAPPQLGGSIDFSRVAVVLPTAKRLARVG
jgi:ABC-2 type transport system ATP-binding protein